MSDKKDHKSLLQMCKDYFKKQGLPFTVNMDEKKERVDKFVAFCKDKSSGTFEKFEDLTLVDNVTKVTIEPAVEPGAAIVMYATDGTPMPAPANPAGYELSDGRIIIVEQDGVIAAVQEKPVDMNEEPSAKPAQEPAATSAKEIIERIETVSRYAAEKNAEFEAYKATTDKKIEDLTAENKMLTDKFNEAQKFTKESFEVLLKEDAKPPVVPVHNPFQKQGTEKTNYLF